MFMKFKSAIFLCLFISFTVAQETDYGVPVVRINTKDGAAISSRTKYITMEFSLTDPKNSANNVSKTGFTDSIRGRGNITWTDYDKKPYRIKFDKKTSLLGLPAAKSWVLLSEPRDRTFLMNAAAFEMGRRMGMPFNHSVNHIALYLNGTYNGQYMLTEQNQVGEGRVNIDKNEGWFVLLDVAEDEQPMFTSSNYNLPIAIKSPEVEPYTMTNSAYDFVKQNINELTDSVKSANFPENGYRNLIDMATFAKYALVQEFIMNIDFGSPTSSPSGPRSLYMYKDKGAKISMGPLWDFDYGYGTSGWEGSQSDYYYFFTTYTGAVGQYAPSFFQKLYKDPKFMHEWKKAWNRYYSQIASIPAYIDSMANYMNTSAKANFDKWKYTVGGSGGWGVGTTENVDFDASVQEMKIWWNNRVAWFVANGGVESSAALEKEIADDIAAEEKAKEPAPILTINYGKSSGIIYSNGSLNVSSQNSSTLKIFDLQGKIVMQKNLNAGNSNVKVENLKKGVYIAKFGGEILKFNAW
ncbi:hypothetical protein AGMMS49938_05700 [Fibrobacterales bacterium]|nr:hypothetical protein AGMMS49938_05700 [Fibrobacterales bacterium]